MKKIQSCVIGAALLVAAPVSALNVGSENSGSIKMEDGVDVSVSSETTAESDADASADAETGSSGGGTVIVNSDALADVAVTITSSAAVASKGDLDAYAKGVVKANTDVRDVTLSETEVSVSHREHARIFGIFPAKVFARTHVKSNGEVSVKFPWYAFAAGKKAAIESKVKAAVKSSIPSVSANAEADAKLSSQAQAQVLEKTVATMKAEFEADAAASAKVN